MYSPAVTATADPALFKPMAIACWIGFAKSGNILLERIQKFSGRCADAEHSDFSGGFSSELRDNCLCLQS